MLTKRHYCFSFWQRTRPAKAAYQAGKVLGTINRFFADRTFRKQVLNHITAPVLTAASFVKMSLSVGLEDLPSPVAMTYSLWV